MLVNCVAYQEGKRLADVDKREIRNYLARPGTFVWVALKDATDAEIEEMAKEFDLPTLAVEDARHGHQRPKIEEYDDLLYVVLHTIEIAGEELKTGEINIFVGVNYIVSIRQHAERGFLDVRTRAEREPQLLKIGSGYVLYTLMDAIVDRYFPVLDAIEMELEALEGKLFIASSQRASIEALYYVKQKLITVKHAVGPLLEYAGKLYGGRVPQVCSGLGEYFRDITDHLVRLNQSIDTARDTVNTAMQVTLAALTINETEVTKRLAAWGALIAVPTFIASVYGMNFKGMPELDWPYGYPMALGIMLLCNAYLWLRFRKAGWL